MREPLAEEWRVLLEESKVRERDAAELLNTAERLLAPAAQLIAEMLASPPSSKGEQDTASTKITTPTDADDPLTSAGPVMIGVGCMSTRTLAADTPLCDLLAPRDR